MKPEHWLLLFVITSAGIASVQLKKLTPAAAITGGLLGWCIYAGAGFTGIAMMAAFFILGTAATSWNITTKQQLAIAEDNGGRRKTSQVIANAGVAALLGLLIYFFAGKTHLFQIMMAAAFASATADTLSSELGNVYGKQFYNILTFQKDKRGLDGVVSLEGTGAGIAGSIIIAVIYSIGVGWNAALFSIIIISGTIGNLSDSLLGATLERKQMLHNDAVNFLNTLIASLAALVLYFFFV